MNRSSGQSHAELVERAVAALVREWGVTELDARAALMRNHSETQRLGRELAAVWRDEQSRPVPVPVPVVDVTDPGSEWTLYLDHGVPTWGRSEAEAL